jgi:hypothetical protein
MPTHAVLQMIAGEDLYMADYIVVGEDGKVYRMKEDDRRYKLICQCAADTKTGEIVTIAVPSFFEPYRWRVLKG